LKFSITFIDRGSECKRLFYKRGFIANQA